MRDLNRAPRTYELMTILHPEVPDEEISGDLERISGYITGAGGTVSETLRESPWGRRRLAYAIRHGSRDLRDGYYTVFHFEMEPNRVRDVEREIKLNERIIRYMVTTWEPQPVDPAQLEQAEIDAEDAAAAAYAAAQAAAAGEAAPAAAADAPAAETTAEAPAAEAPAAESAEAGAEESGIGRIAEEVGERLEPVVEAAEDLISRARDVAAEGIANVTERITGNGETEDESAAESTKDEPSDESTKPA